MNRICQFLIVLGCAVALMFSSSIPVVARSATPSPAQAVRSSKSTAKKKPAHNRVRKTTSRKTASLKRKSASDVDKVVVTAKKLPSKAHRSRRITKGSKSVGKGKAAVAKVVVRKRGHRAMVAKRPAGVISRSSNARVLSKTRRARTSQPESRFVTRLSDSESGLFRRITARSAVVMDAVTGQTIYAQAPDTPAQPASTIKVLTGVISLDVLPRNALVPVS